MRFLFLILLGTYSILPTHAQSGIIRGTVTAASSGETIIGAYVYVNDSTGTTTDIDGTFTLELPSGEYEIQVSYLGYSTKKLNAVRAIPGKVTALNIALNEATTELTEVVVTGELSHHSEAAIRTLQRRTPALLDGISSDAFNQLGDGNAAAAIKRVPGVSMEGGKYVFVRGLGDRYSKITFNGVSIPGLDPDRNTVQMDMFPTNLIDRIIVYKTFTPDLDGDFSGGLINIETKDFPTTKTLQLSVGLGGTPGMQFNTRFIGYKHASFDWAGFASPDRRLPFGPNTVIPDETANDPRLQQLSKAFSPELGIERAVPSYLNQNYALSYGNQHSMRGFKIGVNLLANYRNSYAFYENVEQGIYFKDTDRSVKTLDKREQSHGSIGKNDVLWSALAGVAVKNTSNKLGLTLIHTQNGVGQAAEYRSQNFDETRATLYKNAIDYSQRSVTNLLLYGEHALAKNKLTLHWKLSPTYSNILEPDVRSTRLSYDEDTRTYQLQLGDGAGIDRYFRRLNEFSLATKADFQYTPGHKRTHPVKWKFGWANSTKRRDYRILQFQFHRTGDFNAFSENFNQILQPNNLWDPATQSGMYVVGNRDRNNEYAAQSNVLAGYIMNELPLHPSLKLNYGLRTEWATTHYDGYYRNEALNALVHNELAFLPSVNIIYEMVEHMNLRGSFSKTVARPSFKEKSNAHIDDPISQTVFIGNLDLEETRIQNYDLRWEYFHGREMLSLSAFYKYFQDPIERVPFQLSPNNIQPKNITSAALYGAELECRKALTPPNSAVSLEWRANFTYTLSQVDMQQIPVDVNGKSEYDLRMENARMDEQGVRESIQPLRQMQGQAPYVVNTALQMNYTPIGLNANISYNVQGEKLVVVGSGIVPDIYENPFHSLNLQVGGHFGAGHKAKWSVQVKNLLGDNFIQYYRSYGTERAVYRSHEIGTQYSLSIHYKFH